MLPNEWLEFLVDDEFRNAARAGARDVRAPKRQTRPALFLGQRVVIGDVIDFATESVEGGHAGPFGFGQENECQGQIRGAFTRDGLALLHLGLLRWLGWWFVRSDWRQAAGFSQGRIA